MIGGKIVGWKRGKDFTTISVRGTGCEENDLMTVQANIAEDERDEFQLQKGDSIWWYTADTMKVIIIHNGEEYEFDKVGYSRFERHLEPESLNVS